MRRRLTRINTHTQWLAYQEENLYKGDKDMSDSPLDTQIADLERAFNKAKPSERSGFHPEINRIIRALNADHQPIPRRLEQIEERLEQEEDDFSDNMPV